MPAKIGCDAHKQFSVFVTIDGKGKTSPAVRVEHNLAQYIDFLHSLPPGIEIALEATGHWYWMVDEMEKAGHRPHLANPTEAKKRMGRRAGQPKSLSKFFAESPLAKASIDFERKPDYGRTVKL